MRVHSISIFSTGVTLTAIGVFLKAATMPVTVVHTDGATNEPCADTLSSSGSPPEVPGWIVSRRQRVSNDVKTIENPTLNQGFPNLTPESLVKKKAPVKKVQKSDDSPKSWKELLAIWISSDAAIGTAFSILIHSVILGILACIYISHVSKNDLSLWGVAGSTDEVGSDVTLDTELPGDAGESAPLQMADVTQSLESLAPAGTVGQSLRIGFGGNGSGDGVEGTGTSMHPGGLRIPGHAQTKGSFSAWADPRDPAPGQKYFIVIQVRLPNKVTKFKGSDISGNVIGTDGYRKAIHFRSTDLFPVENGAVEIRIEIPGAQRLVRDTIRVESKLLKEKQMFEIEF